MPSDHPEVDAAATAGNQRQQSDFDIDLFLGLQKARVDDEHPDRSRWRRELSAPGIRRPFADIIFSLTIRSLKTTSSAVLLLSMVVFLILGPNAPWAQLAWNILRGGADEASIAQCGDIGEWFSLFDQHTDRIERLLRDAGSPADWDTATLTKVSELLPVYMGEWLAAMQQSHPPPAGRQLNVLFISLLENSEDNLRAIQQGDLKAQKHLERESTIIQAGIDIEVRYIMNLCI